MTKRVSSLVLAIVMLLEILVPQTTIAKEEVKSPSDKQVQIGLINGNSYDSKLMLELNRLTAKNRKKRSAEPGTSLFGYFDDGQEPKDEDKLKYHGEVKAELTVKGIDGGEFPWKDIFGNEEVHLRFSQINDETGAETGIERVLNVSKAGKYTWTDGEGNPAELPLFNNKLEPLIYEVKLDEEVSDKVKLLTARLTTTGDASPTFDRPDADGRIKYHLTLEIGLQQVASSKFVSEWHTAVVESDRPQIQGTMTGSIDVKGNTKNRTIDFKFPTNDNDNVVVRTNSRRDKNKLLTELLYKTPITDIKTDTAGLTFDTTKKTVKSGDHKFKYDFNYDVINGGKLTMTEILTVTFDANGGEFASITDENAEQKIVKEVDYDKDLTEEVEKPKKDLETFKGWSETKDGKSLSKEEFDKATKDIKGAKTFYAIWDNNEIQAEELTVHESYKNGNEYVNDFIPKLADLKKQVKIKKSDNSLENLKDSDKFAIVDGENEYTADSDELKNYLYGLLQEKDNPNGEPTRTVNVKAKVTFSNKKSKTVDIPIKVIKNIYEAKTLTKKPYYVPDNYVMVTLDPTTKAQDPQKTYYYVNKEAKVVIPGTDPTGADGNTFTKWLIDGTDTEYKLKDKPRHQFSAETTIKAQYSKDVIPQEGDSKPEGTPDNFVKVTFVPTENGTMEGAKIFWVNPEKEVTIPVKDPVGKTYYTFKGWKLGADAKGDKYTSSTPKKFTESTTITATYDEAKNIISYNPEEPITRPDGYVRVTFAAEPGLKLTEQKAYYVKKNAGIKLGNGELVKPAYETETGYKFDKWDKEDSLEIEDTDIVVTAKATKLDNVIPEKDGEGNPNTKPEGYKEVTFVIKTEDAAKGSIDGVAKFYVNPTEYVIINPPATNANTGFEFGAWDKDASIPTVYDKDTTITGSFNGLKDVIPSKNPDGTENKQPNGYKTVTFVIDPTTGGKITDNEVTVYYVNPAKDVTVPQPKTQADTGYTFEKWDQDTTTAKKYTDDTTVKGNFKKLDDIIPEKTGDTPNAKPEGYVTVTFEKGEHGKEITGQSVYYVNPKADPVVKLGDAKIKKPEVKAEVGYKFIKWDTEDTFEIKDNKIVIAQYESIDDVIPKDKPTGGENTKQEGYITVTFSTEANGKIKNSAETTKIVYVNPNKAVVLENQAPEVTPNTGFDFAGWDTSIERAIQYKDGDVIKAKYNTKGDVIPQQNPNGTDKPAGYLTVTFDKGEHGTLSGKTVYYVKPNTEVTVPAPTVKPSVGFEFEKWDKELTQTFNADTTITATYKSKEDVIPQKNTDGSDKPDGYVIVKFKAVNGSLEGTTNYYVKPNVEVDLTNTANAITKKADVGYTAEGGTWKPEIAAKKYTDDAEYEFNFKALEDVIEKIDENTKKPDGYVTVNLIPTNKATDATKAEKVYFVNPNKKVTISNTPVGTEFTDANGITYKYTFTGWAVTSGTINSWDSGSINGQFIQDTKITAKYSTKVDYGKVVPAPVPKKDVVTAEGDTPEAKDLIKNVPGSENDPLPNGTEISYKEPPKVDGTGKVTAKVEVKYPNGKTVVVEVPITVVDNVVPQVGNDKPLVPDSYVKVTVDTTDTASDETYFVKTFWVKPNEEVWIPVINPIGKEALENGVKKTNRFVKWVSDDSNKEYANTIRNTFTKATKITATYEQDKNIEPVPNDGQWIPQGSKNPSPKDFIKNPYDDSDPKNPNNLPPGTSLEFVGGDPDTQTPGTNKTTKIKITYPNGEVKEVPVTYNVTGDVVEQDNPSTKPQVPDNFVKVIVKTTEDGIEKATDETKFEKTFWVNPEKVVTITVNNPKGKVVNKNNGEVDYTWQFKEWDKELTQKFTATETIITAKYQKLYDLPEVKPIPEARGGFIYTDLGKNITDDQYKKEITLPNGYSFDKGTSLEIVESTKPNVNKSGRYYVSFWVTYPDGKAQKVEVLVYVGEARPEPKPPTPEPGYPGEPGYPSYPGRPIPMYPEVRYETIIQEKIVKVPVPVSDNYFKEVRYMQGFNGYFRPNDGLTRAEAAQILANALVEDGYKYNPNFKISYKDVGEAWYTRAVKIVTEANVFAGYDDGNFKPQAKITRNEWIATLKRFQELGDASGNNMNLRDDHWAKGEIQAAFNEGWLKIYTDGLATYKGDEFIPRQEVAAVSNKAFKRIVDKTYIGKNNLSLVTYKDVNTSMWAYEDILCASNTFLDRKDRYIAHWVKEDKNQFNIDTSDLKIVQKNFQRNPR